MRLKILVALFLFFIVLGVLGFTPIQLYNVNDKILHFVMFFILATFLYFLWNLSIKRNILLATGVFLILAIGSEFLQGLLPYRTFDAQDIMANLLGGAAGIGISSLTEFLIQRRRENKRRFGGRREAEYQSALMDDFSDIEEDENDSDIEAFGRGNTIKMSTTQT